jgi:hypothetical protein
MISAATPFALRFSKDERVFQQNQNAGQEAQTFLWEVFLFPFFNSVIRDL